MAQVAQWLYDAQRLNSPCANAMNDDQLLRYSRQIMLPSHDIAGQEALLNAHITIFGAGGLGCPAAQYLVGAGVGHITLIDPDTVDISNLPRQVLYSSEDVGALKVDAAKRRLQAMNDTVKIDVYSRLLMDDELASQVERSDVVLDCTDNFQSRFVINQACVTYKKPLVSGAAIGMTGHITCFDHRLTDTACYQCLYSEQDNEALTCSESGILGPIVGMMGTFQALETIKLITNTGRTLNGKLLIFDGLSGQWQQLALSKNPNCAACG